MALSAQGDEVFFCVWSGVASADDVVNLQLIASPALLAAPAVALQNPPFELAVSGIVQA